MSHTVLDGKGLHERARVRREKRFQEKVAAENSTSPEWGFAGVFGQEFHPKLDQSSRGDKGAETYRD